MARRPSRKELARRAAISKGVRRYWRRVHAVQKAERVNIPEARARARELPTGAGRTFYRELRAQAIEVIQARRYEVQEFAFNLQDRDAEQGLGFYERFRNQTEVELQVSYEYRETAGADPETGEATISFSPGASEEEFWSNYFAAVREYHDEVQGGRGYERFAFYVNSAA